MTTYESRALSILDAMLIKELSSAHQTLGSGMLVQVHDAAATGMAYARVTGRISGLEAARKLIEQVELDMSGRRDNAKKE